MERPFSVFHYGGTTSYDAHGGRRSRDIPAGEAGSGLGGGGLHRLHHHTDHDGRPAPHREAHSESGHGWERLVFSNALQAVSIVSVVQCGVGLSNADVVPKYGFGPIIKFLKVLVVQQILWAVSLSLCKIAILLLYSKIFATRAMVMAARIMAGFTAVWTVITVLIAFFICRPLSDNWLLDLKNRNCGNQPAADGTMGVLNMITDIAVLVMPISYLWKLRLETYKKVALIVTFSLGVL
ncbi:putative integral membrane protein [Colletotrichum sublineola]|uniref:Putative integral membrane protein n=1 Tax=Colletotrichum sublineola TaxID=1173701 RepID=A0A066X1R0_COLSU|nr:putative integral membrane protein [Colletotrichum sublineola]